MKKPLVSVIIPIFNEERYLDRCFQSLEQQTYAPLEYVVIDDGSTDKSVDIALRYNARILRQNHSGPDTARNNGTEHAQGEIFVFVDGDMIIDKDYIKILTRPIIKGKEVGTFHLYEKTANFKNIWSACWSINSDLKPGERSWKYSPKRLTIFRAVKASYFRRVGGYNPEVGYVGGDSLPVARNKGALGVKTTAYHFNPETLGEVFYSARWIGRSPYFKKNIQNALRFCFMNSLRNSLRKVLKGDPMHFIIFKLVYDAGMFTGIFLSGDKVEK